MRAGSNVWYVGYADVVIIYADSVGDKLFVFDQLKVHAILQDTGDAQRQCQRSRSWSDVQS